MSREIKIPTDLTNRLSELERELYNHIETAKSTAVKRCYESGHTRANYFDPYEVKEYYDRLDEIEKEMSTIIQAINSYYTTDDEDEDECDEDGKYFVEVL